MNCVERVKSICKDKGIPISKLEKDLCFSNGYIGQLKKGTLPADRLVKISEYLGVDQDFLLTGEHKKPADHEISGLDAAGYGMLNSENRALIDSMIEKLLKSQSGE